MAPVDGDIHGGDRNKRSNDLSSKQIDILTAPFVDILIHILVFVVGLRHSGVADE